MAGLLSHIATKVLEKIMKSLIEKFWPMVKYLVDNKVLVPFLVVAGTAAGYYADKFIGNTMAIVCVAACVLFYLIHALGRLVTKKKG